MTFNTINNKYQPKNSKLISEQTFRTFSKISDFVSQLNEVFGSKFHELALYNHLVSKTKLSHKQAIKRHIDIFSEFCTRNQSAIINKDASKIVSGSITYSEKVFIQISKIFECVDMDDETAAQIWNHLLVIQVNIDPSGEARAVLQNMKNVSKNEGEFLHGFLNKIEQSVDKDKLQDDPMSTATSLLQSGVLNDLVGSIDSGVKSGNLDLGKLMGMVQQMLGGMTEPKGSEGTGGLDLSGIMGMMGNMMGGAGGGSGMGIDKNGMLNGLNADKIKEQINQKVDSEIKIEQDNSSNPNMSVDTSIRTAINSHTTSPDSLTPTTVGSKM